MPEELNQSDSSPNQIYTARDLVKFSIIGSLVVAGAAEVLQLQPVANDMLAVALGSSAIDRLIIPGAEKGMSWLEKTVDSAVAWHHRRNNDELDPPSS